MNDMNDMNMCWIIKYEDITIRNEDTKRKIPSSLGILILKDLGLKGEMTNRPWEY